MPQGQPTKGGGGQMRRRQFARNIRTNRSRGHDALPSEFSPKDISQRQKKKKNGVGEEKKCGFIAGFYCLKEKPRLFKS